MRWQDGFAHDTMQDYIRPESPMRPTILPSLPTTLALTAILALTACNKAPSGPKTAEQVKQEVTEMVKPIPGQYHSTSKIVRFEVPGMPAAQAERMKGMFAATQGRDFCLTAAEADKGYESMTSKLAQGNCKYDRFDASGGTIDAKLTCQTGKGMTGTFEMKGAMTTESSQMTVKVEQSAPGMPGGGLGGGVKMEMEVTSQRTGDCT
jgi:hypothetical protein